MLNEGFCSGFFEKNVTRKGVDVLDLIIDEPSSARAPRKITMYNSANAETGEEPYLEILNVVTQKAYKVPRSAASDSSAYIV